MNDYAVIFQKIEHENNVYYIPIDVAKGIYLENKNTFTANNIAFKNIIAGEEYGFSKRETITKLMNKYKYMPMIVARKIILHELRKYTYLYVKNENNVPTIICHNENSQVIFDKDIINYYKKYYPEFIDYNIETKNSELDIDFNINKIYLELNSKIKGQDSQIKEILSSIWKNYNHYQNNKSRSILINGEKNSPKKEIFDVIENNTNIPIINTSIINKDSVNVRLNSVEDILKDLLIKYNFDIDKVQNSIIVIDDIDTITVLSEIDKDMLDEYQNDILKLLNGILYTVEIDGDSYTIDTSKITTVLMGNFIKEKDEYPVINAFTTNNSSKKEKIMTRHDYINKGLDAELVTSISNIIELDKPTSEEYIKYIYENSSFDISRRFFDSFGIKLSIDRSAIKNILDIIEKNGFFEDEIDNLIDRSLSIATFEIATNPNLYSELIITEDTIKDNKNYILVKKENK